MQNFPLGMVVATQGAVEALDREGDMDLFSGPEQAMLLLLRHSTGDWGIVSEEDWALNDEALLDGGRVHSAYILKFTQVKIWVITEADRSATTLLLPEDY